MSELASRKSSLFAPALLSWFDLNGRQDPWRLEFLKQKSPYPVWVSEVMLQQTTIEAVKAAYSRFMLSAPTPVHAAQLSDQQWMSLVAGLGYYRRFRMLRESLLSMTDGGQRMPEWPRLKSDWLKVGGVGEYTSSAIASIAFGENCVVIDGNVERVMARYLGLRGLPLGSKELKDKIRGPLELQIDQVDRPGDFNQALMQLGQRVCTPLSPRCEECPLNQACVATKKRLQSEIPLPKMRKSRVEVKMRILIPHNKKTNKVGVSLRPPAAKFLRGIAGFATALQSNEEWRLDGCDDPLTLTAATLKYIGSFRHTITHHDLNVEVLTLGVEAHPKKIKKLDCVSIDHWQELLSEGESSNLGFLTSSLDKKALKIFRQSLKNSLEFSRTSLRQSALQSSLLISQSSRS